MKEQLDKIASIKPVVRESYGSDKSNRPNEHCVWNALENEWIETDDHLRRRSRYE